MWSLLHIFVYIIHHNGVGRLRACWNIQEIQINHFSRLWGNAGGERVCGKDAVLWV